MEIHLTDLIYFWVNNLRFYSSEYHWMLKSGWYQNKAKSLEERGWKRGIWLAFYTYLYFYHIYFNQNFIFLLMKYSHEKNVKVKFTEITSVLINLVCCLVFLFLSPDSTSPADWGVWETKKHSYQVFHTLYLSFLK